ncbi:hypothetical protein [Qipengyuania aquimaris]|uniref:hypothetical protein n=1 Tax=Qipengyuania aquimaris TaxID=255984 RepID=UPI001CD5E0F1|nr:hypothetical protein [Qipengyuania aquimaris]MCA0902376.1 hypothetical protein [Qipengyuania aquimaris]
MEQIDFAHGFQGNQSERESRQIERRKKNRTRASGRREPDDGAFVSGLVNSRAQGIHQAIDPALATFTQGRRNQNVYRLR